MFCVIRGKLKVTNLLPITTVALIVSASLAGWFCFQIWQEATRDNPALKKSVETLPDVVYSAKAAPQAAIPGVLVFLRTAEGANALARVDNEGKLVSESPRAILEAAACTPDTPALPRAENHHELVAIAAEAVVKEHQ
jgi:hypothetical protein